MLAGVASGSQVSSEPTRTMIAVSTSSVAVLRRVNYRVTDLSRSRSRTRSCVAQTIRSRKLFDYEKKNNARVATAPGEGGITLTLKETLVMGTVSVGSWVPSLPKGPPDVTIGGSQTQTLGSIIASSHFRSLYNRASALRTFSRPAIHG